MNLSQTTMKIETPDHNIRFIENARINSNTAELEPFGFMVFAD
jgi:hypothetical protein